jgi:hypothetical protein
MVDYIKNEALGKHQTGLLAALICAIILIGVIYLCCVSTIVMETVKRNQNFQNLQAARKEYQELEKSYLSLISKFNLDYAYSLGFINGNTFAFISRQTTMAQNGSYGETLR